jgi:hypothetical protein
MIQDSSSFSLLRDHDAKLKQSSGGELFAVPLTRMLRGL